MLVNVVCFYVPFVVKTAVWNENIKKYGQEEGAEILRSGGSRVSGGEHLREREFQWRGIGQNCG